MIIISGVTTAPADPAMRGGPGRLGGPFGRGRKEKEGEGEGEKVRKEGKEEKGERLWLAYSPLTVTAQIIMQQCLSHM